MSVLNLCRAKTQLRDIGEIVKSLSGLTPVTFGGEEMKGEKGRRGWTPRNSRRGRGRTITHWRNEMDKSQGLKWGRGIYDRAKWKERGEICAQS